MSQPRVDLCREFQQLSDERLKKQFILTAVAIYAFNMVKKGEIHEALSVLENAIRKGYGSKEIEDAHTALKSALTLEQAIAETNALLDRYLRIDGRDAGSLRFAEQLLAEAKNRVLTLLGGVQASGEVGREVEAYARYIDDIIEFKGFSIKASEASSTLNQHVSKANELLSTSEIDKILDGFNYILLNIKPLLPKLWELADKSQRLFDKYVGLNNSAPGNIRLGYAELLKIMRGGGQQPVHVALAQAYTSARFMSELAFYGREALVHLKAFTELIQQYGQGTNLVSNKKYTEALMNNLVATLNNIRELRNVASSYPPELAGVSTSFTDGIVSILSSLKQQLVAMNPWFKDMFENAEKATGVELAEVSTGMHPFEEQVEKGVSYLAESAKLAYRIPGLQNIGRVALIGAGALDALTQVARPRAALAQIEALVKIGEYVRERWRKEGVAGAGRAVGNILRAMFGSEENVHYMLGIMLGSILLAKLVSKIPLPKSLQKYKAVIQSIMVNTVQGDPVGLVVDLAWSTGVRSALEVLLGKTPSGKVVKKATPGGADDLIKKTIDENLRKAMKREVRELADNLSQQVARMIREGADDVAIKNTLVKALEEHSLRDIMNSFSQYLDVKRDIYSRYFEAVTTKKITQAIIEDKDKASKLIEEFATTQATKNIETIKEVTSTMRDLVEKYKSLLSPQEYDKLTKIFNEIFDTLSSETWGEATGSKSILRDKNYLRLLNLTDELFKALDNSALGKMFRELGGRVATITRVSISNIPLEDLSRIMRSTIEGVVNDPGISDNLRKMLKQLLDKAEQSNLTFKDIDEFTKTLANFDLVKAGEADVKAVSRLLHTIDQYISELMKDPDTLINVLPSIRLIKDRITEISGTVVKNLEKGTEVASIVVRQVKELPPFLENSLNTMIRYLYELKPELAEELEKAVKKLVEEAGSEKGVGENTLVELYAVLNKIKGAKEVKPGLLATLKDLVKGIKEWAEIKLGHKPEAVKSVKNLADTMVGEISELEKDLMQKGNYGFFAYTVARKQVVLPILTDPDTARRLWHILKENPFSVFNVNIDGLDITVARKITLTGDNTVKLTYVLTFPNKKSFVVTKVIRPVRDLLEQIKIATREWPPRDFPVDVFYGVYYDPEALQYVAKTNLLDKLSSGELLRKADPYFDILDSVIVVKPYQPLWKIPPDLLKTIGLLGTAVALNPELRKLVIDEPGKIESLLSNLWRHGKRLPNPPEVPNVEVLDAFKYGGETIILGIPKVSIMVPNALEDLLRKTRKIKIGDVEVNTIPVQLSGQEEAHLVVPLELQKQELEGLITPQTKQVQLPKLDIPGIPSTTPPVTTAPAPVPMGAGAPTILPLFAAGSASGSRRQKEAIKI